MSLNISRRSLFAGAAGATALALVPVSQRAAAQTATPTARVITYSRMIGSIEVITLLDGYFLLEQAWVTGLDPALITEGLTAASLDPATALPLPITAYVIRQGDSLNLMDAGAGGSLGPTAGNLQGVLDGVGISSGDITRIVLSHMHPDHIGGMLTDAAATFANATVHADATELAFWTDPARAAAAPDAVKPWFALAAAVAAAYADRIETFQGEADLGGGVSSVPMPGHTPGHTGYRVSDGADQALLWGDSTAVASLQFAHPDAGIVFDADSTLAAATRRRILDMVVADKMLVSGTHLPFPGFGHVTRKDDAFAWAPEEWKLF